MSRLVSFISMGLVTGFLALGMAGCGGAQHTDAAPAQMANCSMCKAQYEWAYSPKGVALGRKEIKHNCPMCKKDWVAGVDPASTCTECAMAAHECPVCEKAHAK